jgi:hypothetical protein
MVYKQRRYVGKTLAASGCLLLAACGSSHDAYKAADQVTEEVAPAVSLMELPPVYVPFQPTYAQEVEAAVPKSQAISKGRIHMRRKQAYIPPPPPETLEARVNRVISARLADAESKLRQYTDAQVSSTQESVSAKAEQAARVAEKRVIAHLEEQLAGAAKEIEKAKFTAAEAEKKAIAYAEVRLAKAQQKISEMKLAAELAEERAKRYTLEQVQKSQNQAEAAQKAALVAEERAKRYTSEQLLASQQGMQEAQAAAQLAVAQTKSYLVEKIKDAERDAAVAQEATKLVEERALNAVRDAEQRLSSRTEAQISAAERKIAQVEISAGQALTKAQSLTARKLAELENRTRDAISRVARQEALLAEKRLKTYASQQLAQTEERTIQEVMRVQEQAQLATKALEQRSLAEMERLAGLKAREVEDRLRVYTEQQAQDVLVKSASTMRELAGETLAAAEGQLQVMAASARVSDEEIRAVAEAALSDASDTIRVLALQTLAESDGYIRTVARQAVQEEDPAMQAALTAAARQVILDEDNKVAFAIRQVVESTVDEKLEEKQLVARAGTIGHDGVIDGSESLDSADLQVASLKEPGAEKVVLHRPKHREDWINVRRYHVIVHEDNKTLDQMLREILAQAEPFVGPWELKWKLSKENEDIKLQRFSLDAETTFEEFANYLAQYMFNTRGVPVTFNLFDGERVMVISDE